VEVWHVDRQQLMGFVMRALEALFELAWRHRRMTAKGVVCALVFVGARYGFEISADTQAALVVLITLYLGIVGRDKPRRKLTR
jgi:hypothetical protein